MTANSTNVFIDNETITLQGNFVLNSTGFLLNDGGFSLNEANGLSLGNGISLGSNGLFLGNSVSLGSNGLFLGNSVSLGSNGLFLGNSFTINTTALLIGNSITDSSLNSTTLTIGNSTVNVTINSTSFSGSVNVNTTVFALLTGAAFTGQVNVGANLNLSTTNFKVGNSTVNTTHGNSGLSILGGVTTGNVTLNSSTLFLGNSTQNCSINSTTFDVTNDAAFALESNGSVVLPGGLILNWGWVSVVGSSGTTATFHTPYTVNAFSVMVSATSGGDGGGPGGGGPGSSTLPFVGFWSKTGASISITNSTATAITLYMALGI